MATVSICGKVYKAPEAFGNNGSVRFSIGESAYDRDKKEKKMEYFTVFASGKTAEVATKYLGNGGWVYVQCDMHPHKFEKDGQTHYTYNLWVNNLKLVGDKNSSEPEQAKPNTRSVSTSTTFGDDDMPF
jgi:single-stranded DNA-binding protein